MTEITGRFVSIGKNEVVKAQKLVIAIYFQEVKRHLQFAFNVFLSCTEQFPN